MASERESGRESAARSRSSGQGRAPERERLAESYRRPRKARVAAGSGEAMEVAASGAAGRTVAGAAAGTEVGRRGGAAEAMADSGGARRDLFLSSSLPRPASSAGCNAHLPLLCCARQVPPPPAPSVGRGTFFCSDGLEPRGRRVPGSGGRRRPQAGF